MDLDRIACDLLGLPMTHDHRRLLGVPSDRVDPTAVNTALRRRLAQLRVHPNADSEEAKDVRVFLRHIAQDLKHSFPESTSYQGTKPELTALDRTVLAVLIGEGGWNRRCRDRLVAVSASYSITVKGLMRILEALAESSRRGEGPLASSQRSTGYINRSWSLLPPQKSALSKVDDLIEMTAKRFTPELHSPTPVMTIKLAVLFALLTLIAFVLSLNVLLSSDSTGERGGASTVRNRFVTPPTLNVPFESIRQHQFATYPTFTYEANHRTSINAADVSVSMQKDLQTLATTIQETFLRGEHPNNDWITTWNAASYNTSIGWPYTNALVLQTISDQMSNVLLQTEQQQSYTSTLISDLHIPTIQLDAPLSVFQRVWFVGIIAKISCDQRLSASSRALARRIQLPLISTCDELEAWALSLDIIAQELVAMTEFDNQVFPLWENWIAAVQHLQLSTSASDRFLHAIELLIATNVDLSRESNTRKVLGRIVTETKWTQNFTARDRLLSIYRNPNISTEKLWILGRLLLTSNVTTWFADRHLVLPNATLSDRTTIASTLEADWPVEAAQSAAIWNLSIPAGFNDVLAKSWKTRFREYQHVTSFDPASIAHLRILNEAAVYIWKGRPDLAESSFARLDTLDLNFINDQTRLLLHPDGRWSELFFDARSRPFRAIEILEELLDRGMNDLGPQDADTIASAALTQFSSKIRVAATNVIIDQFGSGRNVAVALMNHLLKARSKKQVAKLVASLTDAILPDMNDPRWLDEAHRALVQHAMTVLHPEQRILDAVSSEVSSSLIGELLVLDPSMLPPSKEIDSRTAIKLLVDTWRRALPERYVPQKDLAFNPTGIMQEYLQYQLEYLQLIRAEAANWRGTIAFEATKNQTDDLGKASTNIVGQMTQVELTIARHWDRIMSDLTTEFERMRR